LEEGKAEGFEGGNTLVGVDEKPAAGAKFEVGGGAELAAAAFIMLAKGFP